MAADPLTSATVDGLFNFDSTDDEDPFKDKQTRKARDDNTTLNPRPAKRKAGEDGGFGADLGLDEEVKITKKRKPIAKLDEARLLSANGIPKLRALALSGKFAKKLHLKGKGHEFSDVARLLNYYQLWLDELYPRAKFADGLQLIEKVGHSKRMQTMRKEWIDQGKPGYARDKGRQKQDEERETDDLYGDNPPADKNIPGAAVDGDDSLFIPDTGASHEPAAIFDDMPEDDDLDALLAEQDTSMTHTAPSRLRTAMDMDSEGEDDLDALLAEQETRKAPTSTTSASKPVSKVKTSPFDDDDDDDEDMDDLDALLAEQETRANLNTAITDPATEAPNSSATTLKKSTTTQDEDLIVDDIDDDLDAVLADQEALQQASTRPQSSAPPGTTTGHSITDETPGDNAEVEVEAEADGDDMFSSSPVQGTANPTQDFQQTQSSTRAAASVSTSTQARAGADDTIQRSPHAEADEAKHGAEEQGVMSADMHTEEQEGGREQENQLQPQAEVEVQLQQHEHEEEQDQRQEDLKEQEPKDHIEAEVEEDLEADDMFSSSPVQND
ncbi:hypothetical protein A1O1_03520 [Capronia coronata CBS 617.96]|uniref:Chromosome segregation in meiosis protein n=1 Tax=Capronia coronata CBS 617.96 TaxID=1182541 RepID=W9Z7E2_9EURO|nr:uncharacterized protein A1O1_03520 [Capronia coronata CBS 617.96]EXJ90419.1 hypothetical protein A1O1_03520 [Capronia coronata CBS 617.96]